MSGGDLGWTSSVCWLVLPADNHVGRLVAPAMLKPDERLSRPTIVCGWLASTGGLSSAPWKQTLSLQGA